MGVQTFISDITRSVTIKGGVCVFVNHYSSVKYLLLTTQMFW